MAVLFPAAVQSTPIKETPIVSLPMHTFSSKPTAMNQQRPPQYSRVARGPTVTCPKKKDVCLREEIAPREYQNEFADPGLNRSILVERTGAEKTLSNKRQRQCSPRTPVEGQSFQHTQTHTGLSESVDSLYM